MIERIKELLNEKEWTFASLLDPSVMVEDITIRIYDEMSDSEKLEAIWNETIFNTIMDKISVLVTELVKEEIMQAKVSFGFTPDLQKINENKEVNNNEISERSMGRKSSEERSTDETADSEE